MGLLQLRCTGHQLWVLIFLEAAGASALMFYALMWEAGNLVNFPHKRIGFYNFCLWNKTAGELQCLKYKHLQMMGISSGMILAMLSVYSCQVISIFYALFVACVKWTEERGGRKGFLIIPQIMMILLSGGLIIFLFETSQWIQPSDFTGGFLALLGTLTLLLLQIFTAAIYLSKDRLVTKHSA